MVNKLEKLKIVLLTALLVVFLGGAQSMAASIPDDEVKDNSPTSYTNTPLTSTSPAPSAGSNSAGPTPTNTPKSSEKPSENSQPTVEKIPKAGKENTVLAVAGVSVVVAIISLLKIREYNSK